EFTARKRMPALAGPCADKFAMFAMLRDSDRKADGSWLLSGLSHLTWQIESNRREDDQDDQSQNVGQYKRHDAEKDRRDFHILDHSLDHEDVHADRRVDQAMLHRHDDDHAEPDRIEAE